MHHQFIVVVGLCALHLLAANPASKQRTGTRGACDGDSCAAETNALTGVALAQRTMMYTSAAKAATPPGYGSCGWSVFYDKWLPSFDKEEYEHNGPQGGVHCLLACCEDPTCKGVALMSDELAQCYKYSQLPTEVGTQAELESAHELGNGRWLSRMRPAWSIFVKNGASSASVTLPPISTAPDKIAGRAKCEWEVHYNLWLTTFARGEYEPPAYGGEHCLLACCADPTCDGLALMSNERNQCYKYNANGLPNLLATRQGMPLGDGQWLEKKTPAWSIFVKIGGERLGSPPPQSKPLAVVPALEESLPDGEAVLPAVLPGLSWDRPAKHPAARLGSRSVLGPLGAVLLESGIHIGIVVSIVGALALLALRLSAPEALPFIAKKIDGMQGGPETTKLLVSEVPQGIDLKNLSDMTRHGRGQ